MSKFQNQVVLITGASSGIGEALARVFASHGAKLVLAARRTDALKKLESELSAKGVEVLCSKCDVTKDGDCETTVKEAIAKFGKLDVVVANAGFGVVGNLESLRLEDYKRQFDTNVYGVLRTVYAALPALKQTSGRLAIIGSVTGFLSLPGNSPYTMSKHCVKALCDALYHEFRPYGISVTHIAPGFVTSEIRRVDNLGIHHEGAKEGLPLWLQMPTMTAAKKIFKAIYLRKRVRVVTAHGYWAVWIGTHFPGFFAFAIKSFGLAARGEPKLEK